MSQYGREESPVARARRLEPSPDTWIESFAQALVEFVESGNLKTHNGQQEARYAAFVLHNGGSGGSGGSGSEAAGSSAVF